MAALSTTSRLLARHGRILGSSTASLWNPAIHFRGFCANEQKQEILEEPETPEEQETLTSSEFGSVLKPREVVTELDRFIVGQGDAKRAVAIALRNRWRRRQLSADLSAEIHPRNILMVGPTGCGKTEIARRLAKLADAPFIKVEATKFTEVGYHGRDVDMIIRDLVENSLVLTRKQLSESLEPQAEEATESRILDLLISGTSERTRASFLSLLRRGELEDRTVEFKMPATASPGAARGVSVPFQVNPEQLNDVLSNIQGLIGAGGAGGKKTSKRCTVAEARPILKEMELAKLLDAQDVTAAAIESVEQSGIVFLDELDKICTRSDRHRGGAEASSEGVQRDLLPLIEGSVIHTKYGNVSTDHILFIAAGAFHDAKPSDILPELQGRLPIRVELKGLGEDDLHRILTEPVNNLLYQQESLLSTEGVALSFTPGAQRSIARVSAEINRTVENIGARRLHTVLERIMEQLSFDAADMEEGETLEVDEALVEERVGSLVAKSPDLKKFIL